MDFENFEHNLATLNSDDALEAEIVAKTVIDTLLSIFQGELTSIEGTVFTATAFSCSDGVPKFISSAVSGSSSCQGKPPIREAFNLLEYIVYNFPSDVELMAAEVLGWCVAFLNNAVPNDAKSLSMKLALSIITQCQCYQVDWKKMLINIKRFLANDKKTPPTLIEPIFDVTGTIFKCRPEIVSNEQEWFFKLIENKMVEFNTSKNVSDVLLIACFKGLCGILLNFPPCNSECLKTIYMNLKLSCVLKDKGKRNSIGRAALALFAQHSSYFTNDIYNDYEEWHSTLLAWIDPNLIMENKTAGFPALVKFYKVIAAHLKENSPDNSSAVFDYFHQHLSKSCLGDFYKLKDQFAGLSEFSVIYSQNQCEHKLAKTMNQVINTVHTISENNPSILGMQLAAVSKMPGAYRNGSRLCKLAVSIFDRYPTVEPNFQSYLLECLENSFLSWFSRSKADAGLWLDSICYQGLILCSGHPIYIDIQLLDDEKTHLSYKSYAKLWIYLLTIGSRCTNSVSPELGQIFFDCFITNYRKIINKLDLGLKNIGDESSDPSIAKQAKNPNDFHIFVNLVDLFQEIMPLSDVYQMRNSMSEFLFNNIRLSQNYPLVSGFYKIISTCFKLCSKEDLLQSNLDGVAEFIRDAVQRLDLQKDDLLLANLRMILLAPANIITHITNNLDVIILTGARVGRNYPDILELCLEALDVWNSQLNKRDIETVLREALPSLSYILLDPANPQLKAPILAPEKTLSVKSRGLIRKKLVGPTEKKLAMLQQKFLLFISKLDPLFSSEILEPSLSQEVEGSELTYKVPLLDVRLLLNLNPLLPRITELALSCTERNIRVTACELLHAILLIAVARTREPVSNANLIKQMLRTSLMLSCDSDIVVRDMFSPLLIQITHYFSSKIHMNSKEAGVLIEILMKGVSHRYDYALRDFSAVCLREFVVWAVRQLPPKIFEVSPYNTLAVLRMVCDYALHPDRCKRIGAAIAFNKLYNEFREDKQILNLFWFRLYYCFTCNLEQCSYEEDAEVVRTALDHIQRPLLQQSSMFLASYPHRRIPPGMNEGTLNDLAAFSFHHCKSTNIYLREYSQTFTKKLLAHLEGSPSCKAFIKHYDVAFHLNDKGDEPKDTIAKLHYALWILEENVVDLKDARENIAQLSLKLLRNLLANKSESRSTEILLKSLILISGDVSAELVLNLANFMMQRNCRKDENTIDEGFSQLLQKLKNSFHWLLFMSTLPAYDDESLIKYISDPCTKNYAWILKILDSANCLDQSYSGDKIIIPIFDSLFKKRGNRVMCISSERLFENLQIIVSFCVNHDLSSQLIIELLSDKNIVYADGKQCTKGQHFFECAKEIIVPFLVSQPDTNSLLRHMEHEGIEWLIIILQHIRSYCNQKDKTVKEFIFRIFHEWNLWIRLTLNKWQLFDILRIISQINSFKSTSDVAYFSSWFYGTPNDPNLEIEDVINFFELLPNFVTYLEAGNSELSKALATFEKKWLMFKKGVNKNSPNYSTAKVVIEHLIICLKVSSSLDVWKFTISSLAQNPTLVNETMINDLVHTNSKCPIDHILKILDIMFNTLNLELVEKHSTNFVQQLISLIIKSSAPVSIKFCEQHLPQLLFILNEPLTQRRERDFVRKIAAANIVHTIYSIASKEDRVKIQESLTNSDQSNANIWHKILQACEIGRIKPKDYNKDELELLRLFNCACVNLMCLFASLAPEEKYFSMFVFRPGLWECVVDEAVQYNLTMEFTKVPSIKVVSTSIANSSKEVRSKGQPKYAQSHASTLFQSSLSEDVRNFDLTNASITQQKHTPMDDAKKMFFVLELDSLNQHEVVPMICSVIRHMQNKRYTSWIRHLLTSLENGSTNVKLIILKIIHNVQDDVKPFSSEIAPVILKAIIQLFRNMPVNYLFVDLINMLIEWKPVMTNGGQTLTTLVECFVSKIITEKRNIIKFIFDVVKKMIEEWRSLIKSSELGTFLMDRINSTITDDLNSYIFISFASILLANDLFSSSKRDVELLLTWLEKAMCNKKNGEMAAEACGQLLKKSQKFDFFDSIYLRVCNYVRNAQKMNPAINMLYSIHKFFNNICSDFVSLLISRSWHDRSIQKQLSLEMLLSYVKNQGRLCDEELNTCFTPFAIDILKSNIVTAQGIILKIILEVFQTLDEMRVFDLMPHIVPLSKSKLVDLRRSSCEILIKFCQSFHTKEINIANANGISLICKTALIDMINDVDDVIQERSVTFWCGFNMPQLTKNRILHILTELYSSEAEVELVEYAVRLLFQESSLSPDYEMEIFDHPLTECSYKELNLLTSWRARCSSLAPMFVPSIATELGRLNMEMPESSTIHFRLRETARSLMFTPTFTESDESFSTNEVKSNENEGEFKKPKRPMRFNRNTNSAHFAKRAFVANEKTKTAFEENIKERESNVKLYRSYRVGDFPDIQIKHSHFIRLLVALVGKDSQIAKELFTLLLTSIINDNKDEIYIKNLANGLNSVLKKSDANNSVSISAIFQLSLNQSMHLDSMEVCRVARPCNLLSAGVLLLENNISLHSHDGPTPSKRRKQESFEDEGAWLRLAEFYHEIRDFDALRGILLDKLHVEGSAKKAITAETLMDWSSAVENYEPVLNERQDSEKRNFFNQSYLNCLANLSDWGKLKRSIEGSVEDNQERLWKDPWCSNILLPWYLKAEMMTSLSSESNAFKDLIINSQKEPEKAKQLSLFPEEVTVAHWLNQNIGKTISSMHKCFVTFLGKFSNAGQWDKQLKLSLLLNLQIIFEIFCITKISTRSSQLPDISDAMKIFGKETPSKQSNLLIWDLRANLRATLLSMMQNSNISECLNENIIDTNLKILQASLQQGNIGLAKKYIGMKNIKTNSQWRQFRDLYTALKVYKSKYTCEQKIQKYYEIVSKIEINIDNAMEEDGDQLNIIQEKRTLLSLASDMINLCDNNNMNCANVDYLPYGKRNLQEFWLKSAEATNNDNYDVEEMGKTYVKMSKFCRNYDCGNPEKIVTYLLKAMQCGNSEAMDMLSIITTMHNLGDSEQIEAECKKVPTWMFLKWRNQFVAHLADKPKVLIKNILKRTAAEYPRALSYSLRITKENFSTSVNEEYFVKELSSMVLNSPIEELFVEAIGKLVNPFCKIKYYVEKITSSLEDFNIVEVKKMFNDIKNIVSDSDIAENFPNLLPLKPEIDNLYKISSVEDMKCALENFFRSVKNAEKRENKKSVSKIGVFSKWLSKFSWLKEGILEIPGQYDGLSEPKVHKHACVAFFKPDVIVMKSQREPMKITLVGTNAKEYSFLVKFGEDIRQDERIQQILTLMNTTLSSNKSTRHLQIDGYSVIPLSTNYGLIQWVDSVTSLNQLMAIPREHVNRVFEKHISLLDSNYCNILTSYKTALLNKSNSDLKNGFQSCVNQFDEAALRKGIYRMSSSPEKFYWLRTNFATSLGAMNIAHWVLGVGDRHLENTLVSTVTGRVLGIDFGMSFGFATQFLPLPELVPFRLTPQMVNALKPLNECGWLKQTMVSCIRAFQKDPHVLLAVLEVFVLEPCLDWVEQAKRLAKEQGESISFEAQWYGKSKVSVLKEKLMGGNPVKLIEKDLESGQMKGDLFLRFKSVLSGSAENVRFKAPPSHLSPEQQVEVLLDLATDPLVLSLTYAGWSPWL